MLTHWGRVTHICVGKLTIIGSDNGLSPGRRQAIIWTNAGILLIGPLGTNFSEILIEIVPFSFKKMRLKVSSAKRRPFCLGLNVLNPNTPIIRGFTEKTNIFVYFRLIILNCLTLEGLDYFFYQNLISFCNVVHPKCNILIWNWSSTMNV